MKGALVVGNPLNARNGKTKLDQKQVKTENKEATS